ncbi:hypothetical protein 2 [Beihai sobemo-like virus 23]|uniref:hypothetical protein 2 n=1 Tax=Beihai sobemo-like virus 23 TaxID=1922695 RepID=UPI00090B3ABF|nr:hypothetical protein 2 [Beihai sobemo-like virus 23]APG75711.1 hypothetical protein 2 [Beihai sobemo-like virus 23]
MDDAAKRQSLCYHGRRNYQVSMNSIHPNDSLEIVDILEEAYTKCRFKVPKFNFSWFYNEVLHTVEFSSSPGYPMNEKYSTNAELFGWDGENLDVDKVYEVYKKVKQRLINLLHGPEADPINLFIKDEPHKKSKEEVGAWRLISGASIIDVMVDRYLFGTLSDMMINKCYDIPNKAGWSPVSGGYKWMYSVLGNSLKMMADKSSWDWTMQGWLVPVFICLTQRLCLNTTESWMKQLQNRFAAVFLFARFLNGKEIYYQKVPGIMKSGFLGTIMYNSIAQVALHIATKLSLTGVVDSDGENYILPFAMGDDTIQLPENKEYLEKLPKFGCIIKEVAFSQVCEFAGYKFTNKYCLPCYEDKHKFCLAHLEDSYTEALESYMYLYSFDPDMYQILREKLMEADPSRIKSRPYLVRWFNGY